MKKVSNQLHSDSPNPRNESSLLEKGTVRLAPSPHPHRLRVGVEPLRVGDRLHHVADRVKPLPRDHLHRRAPAEVVHVEA